MDGRKCCGGKYIRPPFINMGDGGLTWKCIVMYSFAKHTSPLCSSRSLLSVKCFVLPKIRRKVSWWRNQPPKIESLACFVVLRPVLVQKRCRITIVPVIWLFDLWSPPLVTLTFWMHAHELPSHRIGTVSSSSLEKTGLSTHFLRCERSSWTNVSRTFVLTLYLNQAVFKDYSANVRCSGSVTI